jgi:ribosomal RNA methyltransferase FmrO
MADGVPAEWLDNDVGLELADHLTAQARKRYRIGEDEARSIVLGVLAGEQALKAAIGNGQSAQQIERTRLFKDLASATRKKIYYSLRRYDRASDTGALAALSSLPPGEAPSQELLTELARGHVSTLERLPGLAAFHEALFGLIGTPSSVLDVGCGVYPLLFPFDGAGATVTTYVAADKDPDAISVLESYARARGDGRPSAVRFDLNEGWPALCQQTGHTRFEVAFGFKLVAVLRRQDRTAWQMLASVPADLIVLSGSTMSMTKNQSIERRERAALLSFAEAAGLTVRADATCDGEYLVAAAGPASH